MTTDLALFGTTVNEVQDLETLLATVSETTENIENEDKSNVSMYFIIIRGSNNTDRSNENGTPTNKYY